MLARYLRRDRPLPMRARQERRRFSLPAIGLLLFFAAPGLVAALPNLPGPLPALSSGQWMPDAATLVVVLAGVGMVIASRRRGASKRRHYRPFE